MKSPTRDTALLSQRPHWQRDGRPAWKANSPFGSGIRKPDESGGLEDIENRNRPRSPGRDSGELRIVGIDCNPGPDAQDRLRRIFAILASHFAGEDMTGPEPGSPPADSPPGDGNE